MKIIQVNLCHLRSDPVEEHTKQLKTLSKTVLPERVRKQENLYGKVKAVQNITRFPLSFGLHIQRQSR
ncbi:hypothetical protein DPMN_038497 [Dreissena polymorpha]|uniref:Uncharacterized protein n=1 Tax=Dreissena polymorpha TaxID=45954 RepID=A0A9D4RNQ2_DREPO|nr:hypothetical protein DPMN_038497 [Dreissena polymorpha]